MKKLTKLAKKTIPYSYELDSLIIDFEHGKCSQLGCCKFASKEVKPRWWVCEYHYDKLNREIEEDECKISKYYEVSY